MLQVRQGAVDGLGVLFDRYHSPLFNFYAKLTGDRGLSEDLVQEVFLRVLKYRQTYTPQSTFRPWIYQIARNVRFDHVRKQVPQSEWTPEMSPSFTPGDPAQRQQESSQLHEALMRLPEEKREVLVLSRLQELKYDEIARLMGCEVGAVKVRVHRALQALKEAFHQIQAERGGAGRVSPQGAGP
ncbi:MAG: RNA polymerase sigma factor [Acidobacteria bacterium]|nr:RNA polymerase sigma factor [Acidobacteriota bacterium]